MPASFLPTTGWKWCALARQHLPIELREIPRLESAGEPISASCVRRLLQEGNTAELSHLLPPTTLEYLRRFYHG